MKTRQRVILLGLLLGSLTLLDADKLNSPPNRVICGPPGRWISCVLQRGGCSPDFNPRVALLHSFFY